MRHVFVAGSINMDVVATAERHPRVGETVAGEAVLYFPGGKGANQAVASAKLGVATTLIGRLGTDAFGKELRAFLVAQGVDLSLVKTTAGAHSGTAIITIANADNTIVVVPGANGLVDARDVAVPAMVKGDVAVSQFEIPLPTIAAFFQRARAAGATTILNPARLVGGTGSADVAGQDDDVVKTGNHGTGLPESAVMMLLPHATSEPRAAGRHYAECQRRAAAHISSHNQPKLRIISAKSAEQRC